MTDTKEKILISALRLFSREGYEAVSVSMIAAELGVAKSALYKHYKSKRDIFESIIKRMERADAERAAALDMPEGTLSEMADAYERTSLERLKRFAEAQFRYWTEDEFARCFRRLLTLEQYRSPEMSRLFSQYLAGGPLNYVEDILFGITGERRRARELAMEFYAPMFLLYSVSDGAEDKAQAAQLLRGHLNGFKL